MAYSFCTTERTLVKVLDRVLQIGSPGGGRAHGRTVNAAENRRKHQHAKTSRAPRRSVFMRVLAFSKPLAVYHEFSAADLTPLQTALL